MTRWTWPYIAQQVIMLALWYGVIRYLVLPTARDLVKELKR